MAALPISGTPLFTDASLVAYYPFNGNSNDAKGTNNGTDTSVSYAAGKFSNAANYNGIGSKTILGSTFTGTTGTITFWFNTSQLHTFFLGQSNTANDTMLGFVMGQYITAGGVEFRIADAGVEKLKLATTGTYNDGTWHLCTLTMSASGNVLYIDGSAVTPSYATGTSASQFWFNTLTTVNSFAFGDIPYNASDHFLSGALDDAAIFSRALTATEANNLFTGNWVSSTTNNALFLASD